MAKFIEVKLVADSRMLMFQTDYKTRIYASETALINVDHIVAIVPHDKTCVIKSNGMQDIHADHSAIWVMGLINGNNQAL